MAYYIYIYSWAIAVVMTELISLLRRIFYTGLATRVVSCKMVEPPNERGE